MDVTESRVSNRKGRVSLGGGLMGPRSFTLEVGVSDGGVPTIFRVEVAYIDDSHGYGAVGLQVTPPKGGRITPEILRGLPLQEKVKEAVLMALPVTHQGKASVSVSASVKATGRKSTVYTLTGGQQVAIDREVVADGPTDEALQEVATLYRMAHAVGDPPTQTITQAYGLPASTAARWVSKARAKGYLGPAMKGRSSA